MSTLVVDTDVCSYIYKGSAEAKLYQSHLFGNILVISFQTQAELLRWSVSAGWGPLRREDLRSRLRKYLIEHSSNALSLYWAEIMESGRRNGRPIAVADAWICSNSPMLGVPLISHNRSISSASRALR